jgi:hypothetical protein
MHRLAILQDIVERIRLEIDHNVPDLAINILLSLVLREGLSITALASKLDASSAELYYGLRTLTVGHKDNFNCAGLLYADHNDKYFLTHKGKALAGDLACKINDEITRKG